MIDRKLSGDKPSFQLPKGTIDTQMHMYLDGYPAVAGGPGLPPAPLPRPQMYRQAMGWLGIDRVVITQGNAHQADNDCLLACLDDMGDAARGVAVITPETPDAEIERLGQAGVVGARIMDLPGGAVGLGQLGEIDAMAANAGWLMAVQFDGSALPEHEAKLTGLKSKWILDHHAKIFAGATPAHVDVIKRLLDTGNCWFKFAGCYESSKTGGPDYADIADVARQIAAYAPERIIWGTNWPHNQAQKTEDYPDDAALIDTVLSWFPDDAARQMALVETPEKLFKF
ncbi:amidohydrolase family protein [Pseudoprimorskyibacter insulae]|uniref:D-galactarolactone isomerase n=1 Tax=Pseudoprimorskyibacter insulae TaxID=1695997 RepID=A0A2R8AY30_9RHOB|nr:amidohydrolase family protein [Pseudoprimorskyibacter insulae]SPF80951.1 D-galactarolactone isomerase [Pseudoprimorskyibacter insulae]